MGSAVSTFLTIAGCTEKNTEGDGEELTICKDPNENCELLPESSSVDDTNLNQFTKPVSVVDQPVLPSVHSLTLINPPYLVEHNHFEESTISMATEAETIIPAQELPTISQEAAILDNSVDIKETEAPLSQPEMTNIEDNTNDLNGDGRVTPNANNAAQATDINGKDNPKELSKNKTANSVLKSKKKEDKDHILRALSSLDTTEEKLAALCKKYADIHEEHRVLQVSFKQAQRRMTVISREKDQIQSEHTKAVMGKSKLESLCRELQKHNKLIKEESIQRAKEEDEKRKEISSKFQVTIGEIQQQMQDNHDKNSKLREENADLADKLKGFIGKYEIREEQLEKLMKHKEIEQQLADAKLQQATILLQQEQERGKQEKDLLTQQTTESMKKSGMLETQLGMYKDRYEDFQTTINKSNDMFQKFKSEMEKMSKRIKKLEKDGASWKAKWQGCNKALLDMVEEKQKFDQDKAKLLSKNTKLESLCRALQNELHGKKGNDVIELSSEVNKTAADTSTTSPAADTSTTSPAADTSTTSPAADTSTTTPDTSTKDHLVNGTSEVSSSSCDSKTAPVLTPPAEASINTVPPKAVSGEGEVTSSTDNPSSAPTVSTTATTQPTTTSTDMNEVD